MLIIVVFPLITFLLHLVWEFFHVSLYGGYQHLSSFLPIPIFASIGDVAYSLLAILLVSIFKKRVKWISSATPLDYIGLAIIGFCIAVFVEYKAMVFERWYYLSAMPIIPGLEVGLSPILQMTVLLPLSLFITNLTIKLIYKHSIN